MVETKKVFCYTYNIGEILADLKKWNVSVRDYNSSCVMFELQTNNTIYEIVLYNSKVASLPLIYITSFKDLQAKIFNGNIIWNWK